MAETLEKVRTRYDRNSRFYDLVEYPSERIFLKGWREMLLPLAKGRILEVGFGTGKNLPYYPPGSDVTAIDISRGMISRALSKRLRPDVKFSPALMDVQNLGFKDDSFDTVVATFVFCSVPDPLAGLRELKRVCRPGGRMLLLEHVRSRRTAIGRLMDLLNPFLSAVTGANINRDTVGNLLRSGLKLVRERNLLWDIFKLLIAEPAK